jgi:hypothetical protein
LKRPFDLFWVIGHPDLAQVNGNPFDEMCQVALVDVHTCSGMSYCHSIFRDDVAGNMMDDWM